MARVLQFRGTTRINKSRVRGEEGLLRNLEAIMSATNGQALLKPLIDASRPMADDAARNAPFKSGDLREGITHDIVEVSPWRAWIAIGPGRAQFYGMFQELGWRPGGKGIKGHAHPFLRPAYDAHKRKVAKNLRADLWELIRSSITLNV